MCVPQTLGYMCLLTTYCLLEIRILAKPAFKISLLTERWELALWWEVYEVYEEFDAGEMYSFPVASVTNYH